MLRTITVYARVIRALEHGQTKVIRINADSRSQAENAVRRTLTAQGYEIRHIASV